MYTLCVLLYFIAAPARCHGDDQTISTISTFRSCTNRKMNSSAILQTVSVISEIDCVRACKNDKKCKSSNFVCGNTEHQCQLLSTSFDDSCSDLQSDITSRAIGMISHIKTYPTCSYDTMNYPCHFGHPINETCQCECEDGFRGEFCQEPPRDCSDFGDNGSNYIYLPETNEKLRVTCSGGMMYSLQFLRENNAFERYRNLTWSYFKFGLNSFFSHPFWIGADIIHNITTKLHYNYSLVIYLIQKTRPPGIWLTSEYHHFYLGDESTNYTIHFATATIPSKGVQVLFDNTQFRTMDYNSDHCTNIYQSSWWYPGSCAFPPPLTGNSSFDGTIEEYEKFYFNLKRI